MRKIKKLFAGCLILVMFSTLYSPAFAANNSEDVAEVVLREVTSLYADIYSISDATATVSDVSVDDAGNKTFTVNASFHRTLKASSADEAPLIKELAVVAMQINDKSDLAATNSYITARKADIQRNYIGKPQDTNVELQVTLSSGMTAADISIDNIEYVGMVQNLPVTSISPNTGETLKLAAEYELEKAIASSVVSTIMVQKATMILRLELNTHGNTHALREAARTMVVTTPHTPLLIITIVLILSRSVIKLQEFQRIAIGIPTRLTGRLRVTMVLV